jgi:uncharacterized protein (TIGR02284 family)
MSADKSVTKHVMSTVADGRDGYRKGAERLSDTNAPELAAVFSRYSEERNQFHQKLESMSAASGEDLDEQGSIAAQFHRGWMAMKDVIAGSNPSGVLEAAQSGEDHAVGVYQDALKDDISPELRTVLQGQLMEVRSAKAHILKLQGSHPGA